jgi:hypothetical protein
MCANVVTDQSVVIRVVGCPERWCGKSNHADICCAIAHSAVRNERAEGVGALPGGY